MRDEQEEFWRGEFGDDYVKRNNGRELIAAKIDLFSKSLKLTQRINSVIELGCNRGLNALALKHLFPSIEYTGIEISKTAFELLCKNEAVDHAYNESIYNVNFQKKYDLAVIAGVLIHLNPDKLSIAYSKLKEASQKYVMIAEYFNPTPVSLDYRGHSEKLYKRDFAKEFIDKSGFKLLDYGFLYRHDCKFKHDDMTWFLLEKGV